jgi:hypothetical protein
VRVLGARDEYGIGLVVCEGVKFAKLKITIPGTGIACWQAWREWGTYTPVYLTFAPIGQGQKASRIGSTCQNIDV